MNFIKGLTENTGVTLAGTIFGHALLTSWPNSRLPGLRSPGY